MSKLKYTKSISRLKLNKLQFVGWGLSAICVGYFVDAASQKSLLYDYTIAFNVMIVCWFADAFVVGKMSVRDDCLKILGSPSLVVMGGDSCSEGCGF